LKLKLKMKTRTLVITLGVAAMASLNVVAGGLLSPKAADTQSKTIAGYNSDPSLTATGLPSAPPRVVESQSKIVPGKSAEVTPSLVCVRKMSGSPKMIGACADHPGGAMSCCSGATTK
jgi:hypothetical protein